MSDEVDALRIVDFLAVLAAWTLGALCLWWTNSWLVGVPVCVVLTFLYHRVLRERLAERVTRRQREYDATADGRLTAHH